MPYSLPSLPFASFAMGPNTAFAILAYAYITDIACGPYRCVSGSKQNTENRSTVASTYYHS